MDDAIKSIKKTDAEIIILDSIQTVTLNEFTARAASPTQTVECISKLVTLAKDPNKKRAVFIVCHMTKQDEMAGLRTLEHMVDSVLLLEGQSDDSLRTLTSTKNRFGRTGEVGLFKMEENGLLEIENPSEFFVTKREKDICASALSVVKEGSRMLVVEVESLVSKSFTNYPIRIGDSLKKDQLNTLISILEQRAGFNLYDKNVILKVTGGLSITEQAVNLAVIVSIVSSILNKPIARDSVFICEVGLTGELKKVTNIKERLLELDRMGYKKAYISYENTIPKEIKNLKVHYPIRGGFFNKIIDYVYAVDGVDMVIEKGKTYGLIGESGSGKSTIGKSIIGLEKITDGQIIFEGKHLTKRMIRHDKTFTRDVQMIFQDNMSSLDPKKRVLDIIAEPLRNFEKMTVTEERKRILELLDIVGMPEDALYKYSFEFSGGQRQRIGVARAIALNPKLIIADEPVSALDLSVQAQVLNFMKKIQKDLGLSYLFISHDLGVVKHMCDYINIMHRGRLVERGTREDIYKNPQHIYTKRLIAAIPETDPRLKEQLIQNRIKMEQEYDRLESEYYDENGRVFDLIKLSDTHYVAKKGGKIICGKPY